MSGAGKTQGGTRFRIFPQAPVGSGPHTLETVSLSPPAGSVRPGPADDRMYTIEPIGKREIYGTFLGPRSRGPYLPPWRGPAHPPVQPDDEGHFDYLTPGDDGFAAAHLYGCARFTLDVWEGYLREPVRWHFAPRLQRLELTANRARQVAIMGFGFLEVGRRRLASGELHDYAINFDIVAHEIGHLILEALTRPFSARRATAEFHALHEMSSDWVSLITCLHFDSVQTELLEETQGNLDSFNPLTRLAEFDTDRQLRLATNDFTLYEFVGGWESEHDLAMPLIGVFFDIFIDIYHELLVDAGAVTVELERLADRAETDARLRPAVQRGFAEAYARNPEAFREALGDVRDMAAEMLITLWRRVRPSRFRFGQVARWLRDFDREVHDGRFRTILARNLEMRGIGVVEPGPRRGSLARRARAARVRRFATTDTPGMPVAQHRGRHNNAKKRRK
ncbi:MAG: hypothetical protein AAF677_03615 [Pseudomonadota bacterium]